MAFGDFTVDRASKKYVLGADGYLKEYANDEPAIEFNPDGSYKGVLIEPSATNEIRNNTMVGAVAGTPGTLPTNWGEDLGGLTREVVATGTEIGINYVDIRLHGTATSTVASIRPESTTQIVASNGQVWTSSTWIKKIDETNAPSDYLFGIYERTNVGGFVSSGQTTITPSSTLTRYSFTRTLSGGGTVARTQPFIAFTLVNNNSYDFTIRIGLPQMETGAIATSAILTSGSADTRLGDSITLTSASSLIGQTEGFGYIEVDMQDAGINRGLFSLSDGTNNNRIALQVGSANTIETRVVASGSTQGATTGQSVTVGVQKWGYRYSSSGLNLSKNGTTVASLGAITIPATTQVRLGLQSGGAGGEFNGWVRAIAIGITLISESELNDLTTL